MTERDLLEQAHAVWIVEDQGFIPSIRYGLSTVDMTRALGGVRVTLHLIAADPELRELVARKLEDERAGRKAARDRLREARIVA